MNVTEFAQLHDVNVIIKTESRAMRVASWFLGRSFMSRFWTTYRLPWESRPTITYPESNDISKYDDIPDWALGILAHEMVHVEDMRTNWGLLKMALLVTIFPLPTLFSGRWIIEFPAYLLDIRTGRLTVDQAVDILWNGYFYPWPKSLMRRKFNQALKAETK